MINAIITIIENEFRKLIRILDFHKHVNPLKNVSEGDVKRPNILAPKLLEMLFKTNTGKHKEFFRFNVLQQILSKIKVWSFLPISQMFKYPVFQKLFPFDFLFTGEFMAKMLELKLEYVH